MIRLDATRNTFKNFKVVLVAFRGVRTVSLQDVMETFSMAVRLVKVELRVFYVTFRLILLSYLGNIS